jgi:hypothetical protein
MCACARVAKNLLANAHHIFAIDSMRCAISTSKQSHLHLSAHHYPTATQKAFKRHEAVHLSAPRERERHVVTDMAFVQVRTGRTLVHVIIADNARYSEASLSLQTSSGSAAQVSAVQADVPWNEQQHLAWTVSCETPTCDLDVSTAIPSFVIFTLSFCQSACSYSQSTHGPAHLRFDFGMGDHARCSIRNAFTRKIRESPYSKRLHTHTRGLMMTFLCGS